MEHFLEITARYGTSGAIGAAILYLVLRMAKSGTFPEISVRFGRNGYRSSDADNGGNGNGKNGGNGKGDTEKIDSIVLKALREHQSGCAPEMHRKIEEYNKSVLAKIDAYHTAFSDSLGDCRERVARIEGTEKK
jgi:hypothetical protein